MSTNVGRKVLIAQAGGRLTVNGMHMVFGGGGAVDEHGNPVERTKMDYPYSYDGFVLHRFGPNKAANDTIYSDRLYQWNYKKHDELCKKHFGDISQNWNTRGTNAIEAFLRDWCEDPELKLILVMEYCNRSSGYPCWRFDFFRKPVPVLSPAIEVTAEVIA